MHLTIDHLGKRYGEKAAVRDACTRLGPGVHGLLGANGAGKTTLMRMICGVTRPSSGAVHFDDRPIDELGGAYRARLGYLPQDFGYYPEFTALDFMEYLGALKGLTGREARERSKKLLADVGLSGEERRRIRTFSGGMKQRLGIAQAVLNDPAVLVLDEPTAGLDPKERIRFRNLIASFAQNKIVLLSTHIVSDVESIADNVLIMRDGTIEREGAPSALVHELDGKAWRCRVPAREADRMAARFAVSTVHYTDDAEALVRVVADRLPAPDAEPAQPTLEDLYLHLFSEKRNADTVERNSPCSA